MKNQTELPLPPTDSELPLRPQAWTSCANCNEVVHLHDAVIKQFWNGTMVDVEHWCSDDCHHEDYIKRLNQVGL